MPQPRVNVLPPPGRESASGMDRSRAQSTASGLDPAYDPPQRASTSSRRPSGASIHSQGASVYHGSQLGYSGSGGPQSPVSVSSSGNHPWATPLDEQTKHSWSHSPQTSSAGLPNPGGAAPQSIQRSQQQQSRMNPAQQEDDGPRSAPTSSPLTAPVPPYGCQQPLRSSSTPDPRTTGNSSSPGPEGSYFPVHPGPPYIHDASHHVHQSQPQGSYSIPRAAFMSNAPSSSSGDPPRRSETPTSVSSSHAHNNQALQQHQHQQQPSSSKRTGVTYCAKCGLAVRGQFVRALHQVYHLDCFRCKDCDKVVAQKFFPIEDADGQHPLCERDYFARLNLICGKCDQALRSSYITACGEKFHVEHFSCSVCDTVFGPNDSYYEHNGKVYCHYHYSISFANKCVGCETAILKQFVEINRNGRDECWHPECYMIHKFWNVRLASRNFTTPSATTPVTSSVSLLEMSGLSMSGPGLPAANNATQAQSASVSPGWGNESTPEDLKDRQITMELKVSQIWLVLSGFEESSAACIGDMLRVVNERKLLDVILLAEKFILHVETLFAVIDDLEAQFAIAGAKGMSHAREAKQLCRKLVNFFSMLSQITPHGGAIPNMQELLAQVTQLAHYLKILIRIALTGAIKLDREQGNPKAMMGALARLHLLSLDNSDPSLPIRGDHPEPALPVTSWTGNESPEEMAQRSFDSLPRHPDGFLPSTQNIGYGYRSLAVEATGESTLRGPQDDRFVPNDGCARCNGAIEDDCVRQGMFNRWHPPCVECKQCGDQANADKEAESSPLAKHITDDESHEGHTAPKPVVKRKPPRAGDFSYEPPSHKYAPADIIWCNLHRTATAVAGFQPVSRLEQFAFLLHVALRRLYLHFREHHGIASALTRTETGQDVKRVKSVTLDRKLSSTARLPQRSTVVESPAGKMADENGQMVAPRDSTVPVVIPPGGEQAVVDVIRPAFARNNTQIRIVSQTNAIEDGSPEPPSREVSSSTLMIPGRRVQEDDAITLNDIPMLASRSHPRSPRDLVASLSPLEALIVRHFALLAVCKTGIGHLVEIDDVIELLDSRKNQWWNKIFKGQSKKDQKRKGIFGVPIEYLIDRTGSDSQQGCDPNVQLRVPEFIEAIVSSMRQQDLAVEGIFRKNGNIRKLNALVEALDKDSTSVVLTDENPVQLAALLKRFLREMPDPLLTFRLHKLFCAAAVLPNPEDRKRTLHLLVTILPKPNRDVMEVLFVFLRWVATFSYKDEEAGSLMDVSNLATVITPNILYGKGQNAAKDESLDAIKAVLQLLEAGDDLYRVPPELLFVMNENVHSIFHKDIDLPPKEIHKLCAKYMAARMPQQQRGQLSAGLRNDRPADLRLSGYRSDNSVGRDGRPRDGQRDPRDARDGRDTRDAREMYEADQRGREPTSRDRDRDRDRDPHGINSLRATVSPAALGSNNSRPTSWGAGPPSGTPTTGASTPGATTAPGFIAMPTPQLNGAPVPGASPTFQHPGHMSMQHPLPSPGWRGPFQGAASGASSGSRHSSRGSAPPSPGGPEERRSFNMERDRSRDRSWTPNERM